MDLLLRNAKVYTVDPSMPWAQAVAIDGDRIAWVGADDDAPEATETIDLGGRLLLPGFVDAHNHVRLGSDEDAVILRHAETLEPIASLKEGPMRMLGAAKLGTTRLIDNIAV